MITNTASAAVPAGAKVVAVAHGMSIANLVREFLACIAARDAEILAWLDKACR